MNKAEFENALKDLANTLTGHVSTDDGQWSVKGFIDAFRNVYTISSDTKIVSKILEVHLFPKILAFADQHEFAIVLAEHQNYYPDISFVLKRDESVRFAVDFKTTTVFPVSPGFAMDSLLVHMANTFRTEQAPRIFSFLMEPILAIFAWASSMIALREQRLTKHDAIVLRNFIPSPRSFRISSSSLQRNGKSLAIRAALETQPISEVFNVLRISFRATACSLSWVRSGLTITG